MQEVLGLGLKSFISQNVRNFLRVGYFYFSSSESDFLKYKRNISQESFISGNIRKYARLLFLQNSASQMFDSVLNVSVSKYKEFSLGFLFPKNKKSFLLRKYKFFRGFCFLKYKKFFNIRVRKFHFSESIRNFLTAGFLFYFSSLC